MNRFRPISYLSFLCIIGINAWGQVGTLAIDIFPLAEGLQRVYAYRFDSFRFDKVADLQTLDTGKVEYMVVSSYPSGDTMIVWTMQQTERLFHHHWVTGTGFDTTFSTEDTVLFSLYEYTAGLHELSCYSKVWWFRRWPGGDVIYRLWTSPSRSVLQTDFYTITEKLVFDSSHGVFERHYRQTSLGHTGGYVYIDAILIDTPSEVRTVEPVFDAFDFRLSQNFPNPFNPSTTITYELPKFSVARLSVFDMLGREVAVLVDERKNAGVHDAKFDATGLSSGVYFYRLTAGSHVQTRKLVLIR